MDISVYVCVCVNVGVQSETGEDDDKDHDDGDFFLSIKKILNILNLLDVWLGLVDHQLAAGTVLFLAQMDHDATVAD